MSSETIPVNCPAKIFRSEEHQTSLLFPDFLFFCNIISTTTTVHWIYVCPPSKGVQLRAFQLLTCYWNWFLGCLRNLAGPAILSSQFLAQYKLNTLWPATSSQRDKRAHSRVYESARSFSCGADDCLLGARARLKRRLSSLLK